MIARLERRRGDESGLTVPELAVVTFILSIVVVVMFGFLDQVTGLSARTDRQAEAESSTQQAMRVVTQNLRGALPMSPCTSDGATPGLPTSFANCVNVRVARGNTGVDACPYTDYVYAIVDYSGIKKLIENRREINCAGTVSDARVRRLLLENLANAEATEPLFTYYRDNGTTIPATDLAAVPQASSLRMLVKVRYSAQAPALSFASVVAFRNNR